MEFWISYHIWGEFMIVNFVYNDNLNDDGIYTFEVTATDLAGNVGGESDKDKIEGAK